MKKKNVINFFQFVIISKIYININIFRIMIKNIFITQSLIYVK